jgi:hypothetical protein
MCGRAMLAIVVVYRARRPAADGRSEVRQNVMAT